MHCMFFSRLAADSAATNKSHISTFSKVGTLSVAFKATVLCPHRTSFMAHSLQNMTDQDHANSTASVRAFCVSNTTMYLLANPTNPDTGIKMPFHSHIISVGLL